MTDASDTAGASPSGFYGWWRAHTTKWGVWLFLFLFAVPALSGLVGRLVKRSGWYSDWNEIVCGGVHVAAGHSPYGAAADCPELRSATFVYPGWMARAIAPAVEALGPYGIDVAYSVVFAPVLLFLFWLGFVRTLPNADWRDRLPFLGIITGSALACGNISYPVHAMVALAALTLPRGRLLFIAATIAACAVKPFFATFLIVLLFEDRALWRRVLDLAWAGAACAGMAALVIFADPEHAAWTTTVQAAVLDLLYQSIGFFGWWTFFGAPASTVPMGAAFVVYAGLLSLAAWVLAQRCLPDTRTRVVFGLGVAALLNPRLMDYDLLLLAPAPVLAAAAVRTYAPKLGGLLWTAFFVVCVAALVLNAADMVPLGIHLGTLGPALIVMIAGAYVALQRSQPAQAAAA